MICTYCKANNADDCIYCPACGKPSGVAISPGELPALVQTIAHVQRLDPGEIEGAASPLVFDAVRVSGNTSQGHSGLSGAENTKLSEANLCRLRKNWVEATDLCIAVLRESPANSSAHSLLGDIYRDQNRSDEAVRWYRMALDLQPNPFDLANLEQLERQLSAKNASNSNASRGTGKRPEFEPFTGSLSGGTSHLMGIAPQKWLKGITVASLSFLGLFVIYLLTIPNKRVEVVPRAVTPEALVSDARSGSNALPPALLSGPTTLPAGEQPSGGAPVARAAGTGLPPDLGSATAPAVQPQPGTPGSSGLAPASVRNVAPMGSGAVSGQVGLMAPADPQSAEHTNSLTGGMELSHVDTGHGSASIQLVSPNASAPHDTLVRNLYRAARLVLSNDTTIQRVSVTIHSESADGPILISADVDRLVALSSDPDNEDSGTLASRIRVH